MCVHLVFFRESFSKLPVGTLPTFMLSLLKLFLYLFFIGQ
uniref:Uncharacterized protein n=1 Tax=Anguilla anguilla TaxID=7936 RepID=A0A0E9QM18_ANGAN